MEVDSKHMRLSNTPPCELYVGDCCKLMPMFPQGSFDLIFGDPPFNIGRDYTSWNDSQSLEDYRNFTKEWLKWCVFLLSERGTLWVNVPDEVAARVVVELEDTHGLVQRNWCIWHYRFGQCGSTNFIKSKVHALCYVRDKKKAIWNKDAVLVPSDRNTKYNDARTKESKTPGMRLPLDVWGVDDKFDDEYPGDGPYWGRVQGNSKERRANHDNQLPEKYLERVILSTSNPDSCFFTPFAGSGTELVVANALGRTSVGIEIGEEEATSIAGRLQKGAVRVTGVA